MDAISGFAVSIMPIYAATGVKAHFMLFSAVGLVNYGYVLLTQPDRVATAPELCAAFVDGMLEGLKATMLDPAEAMKLFFKQVPEMALAAQAQGADPGRHRHHGLCRHQSGHKSERSSAGSSPRLTRRRRT